MMLQLTQADTQHTERQKTKFGHSKAGQVQQSHAGSTTATTAVAVRPPLHCSLLKCDRLLLSQPQSLSEPQQPETAIESRLMKQTHETFYVVAAWMCMLQSRAYKLGGRPAALPAK